MATKKFPAYEVKMKDIYRTTKCFGVNGQGLCKGSFPKGFLKWINEMGWNGLHRCYLCSGMVDDKEAFKVDVRPEVKPDLLCDASNTKLPDESYDWIMIDPPYTKDLARDYYGTDKNYHGINAFTKEAERLCKVGGLILTLSYEIPKRIKNCDFIAVVGVYTVPFTGYMRCFTVSKKKTAGNFFPTEDIIIAKSDKSSEDLPSPETEVSVSPAGRI